MDLNLFIELVKKKSGLNFHEMKNVKLENALKRRMLKKDMAAYKDYFCFLLSDAGELRSLIDLLTINETYFFREAAHLDLLVNSLAPEVISRNNCARILSVGCSTGEEPYSVVMALMERFYPDTGKLFSVTAVDINREVLHKARTGLFSAYSFRNEQGFIRDKYFDRVEPNHYRIKEAVRQKVEFQEVNLLSEEIGSHIKKQDIIFYRNVSIYFDAETRSRVFASLAGALDDGGYLFVGSSETLCHDLGILSLVKCGEVFLYRKKNRHINEEASQPYNGHLHPAPDRRLPISVKRPAPESLLSPEHGVLTRQHLRQLSKGRQKIQSCTEKSSEKIYASSAFHEGGETAGGLFEKALSFARTKQYEEALNCTEAAVKLDRTFVRAYMLKAGLLLNLKQLEKARDIAMCGLELDDLCLEGYLLLGLISKELKDARAAVVNFKKALYVAPSCWLALFHIAGLYQAEDDTAKALHGYERVVEVLEAGGFEDYGFTFFPLSFTREQLVHLCRHNIAGLKKRLAADCLAGNRRAYALKPGKERKESIYGV